MPTLHDTASLARILADSDVSLFDRRGKEHLYERMLATLIEHGIRPDQAIDPDFRRIRGLAIKIRVDRHAEKVKRDLDARFGGRR